MNSLLLFGGSALIFLVITIILCALILLINFVIKKNDRIGFQQDDTDSTQQEHEPLERRIAKRARFKPDRVIMYGQNTFAYNSRKKKIYIQTYMDPDGILFDYTDIISFEIFEEDDASDKTQCGALSLKIRTGKPGYEEITLTYISSPEDRAGFVYASAGGAVKEVKAVLEGL